MSERKAPAAQIDSAGPLLYADHVERNWRAVYAAAGARDMEGSWRSFED
jgi:hypothetical protein